MEEEIRELEEISQALETKPPERALVREKVMQYCEEFLEDLEQAAAYTETPDKGAGLLKAPITDEGASIDELIDLLRKNVDRPGLNPASPRHFGYIPGGGLYYSALGDYLADVSNRYAGLFLTGPGAVRMENMLISWMAEIVGFPEGAGGNLTTGGSLANLIAIVTARDAKDIRAPDVPKSVVYVSEQHHHSLQKALRIAGFTRKKENNNRLEGECYVRAIPIDHGCRMIPEELEKQIVLDKANAEGLNPFLVVATAGTTDVGAIDPLEKIGRICAKYDLWYHVDAAYGGFFCLIPEGKKKLRGIELADSVTMDPHKGLFLPYGLGVILVKDRQRLYNSFFHDAKYIRPAEEGDLPSPGDHSPELTKHFRGLRLWLPLKLLGLKPFRAALKEKLLLASYFHDRIKKLGFDVVSEPDLSVVAYRYVPEEIEGDLEKINKFNQDLLKEIEKDGRVFISDTKLGKEEEVFLRFACLSFRTHLSHVMTLLEILEEQLKLQLTRDFAQGF
jgi:glutamate/tyrosine decarboxylase-like PLP-dependent enzyme